MKSNEIQDVVNCKLQRERFRRLMILQCSLNILIMFSMGKTRDLCNLNWRNGKQSQEAPYQHSACTTTTANILNSCRVSLSFQTLERCSSAELILINFTIATRTTIFIPLKRDTSDLKSKCVRTIV